MRVTIVSLLAGSNGDHRTVPDAPARVHRIRTIDPSQLHSKRYQLPSALLAEPLKPFAAENFRFRRQSMFVRLRSAPAVQS